MATYNLLDKTGLSTMLTKLKTKIPSTWAGSDSQGGSATSAKALTSDNNKGSSTQPVYFSSGKPQLCNFTVATSVPSGAKFTDTDTTYTAGNGLQLDGTQFGVKNTVIHQGLSTRNNELILCHDWINVEGDPDSSISGVYVSIRELYILVSWNNNLTDGIISTIKGAVQIRTIDTASYSVPKMTWSSSLFGRLNGTDYNKTGSEGMGTLYTSGAHLGGTAIAFPMTNKYFTAVDTSIAPVVWRPEAGFTSETDPGLYIRCPGTLPSQYTLLVFI